MFETTEPKIDERPAESHVGIRSQMKMQDLGSGIIPQQVDEVAAWLEQQGIEPSGPPIIRYYSCPPNADGVAMLDILIGWPVASAPVGNDRFIVDALPAGRYASLIFTGVENGYEGNGVLINWAEAKGIKWDSWDVPIGEVFAGRVEYMLDGPDDDPDPGNWRTEVAIKVADN